MAETAPIPVLFIHGLWMHASCWSGWTELFTEAGYHPVAPGWPGDSATAEACRQNPDPIADRGIAEVTEHYAAVIADLPSAPIVVGHSFGGLIAQRLLGQGLARGVAAIAPAQFRGITRLPLVQLRTAWPVLGRPANRSRAVSQTAEQFHRGFANAVPRAESDDLYARYAIPAPARPLFEAGAANFSPRTAAAVKVDAERGPLLLIAGGDDRTVPAATVRAAFKRYRNNPSVTEFAELPGRSHSQTIDHGWRETADRVLAFLERTGLSATVPQS